MVGEDAVAVARSVQVFVDLATGSSKAVPDSFRERVRAFLPTD